MITTARHIIYLVYETLAVLLGKGRFTGYVGNSFNVFFVLMRNHKHNRLNVNFFAAIASLSHLKL